MITTENTNIPDYIRNIASIYLKDYLDERIENFPTLAALDVDDVLYAASYQPKKESLLEYDPDEPGEVKTARVKGAIAQLEQMFLVAYAEDEYRDAGMLKNYPIQHGYITDWAHGTCIDEYKNETNLKAEIAKLIEADRMNVRETSA